MLYNLSNPIDMQRCERRFEELKKKKCIIELKEKKPRSTSQNSYLHLILTWFAMELGYNLNEAKHIYKQVNKDIYFYMINDTKIDADVEFWRSSADLDSVEMTKSIEVFRKYSNDEAGVYLPQPNERDFLQEIEVQASQNEFI